MRLPLLLTLCSCVAPMPSAPVAAADGAALGADGRFPVLVVGGLAGADAAVDERLQVGPPQLVVLAGDAVARSTAGDWSRLHQRVEGLPVVPLPGDGEARRDPHRRRFLEAWDGLGVAGLDGEVSWRSFTVATGRARWRVVVLDADRERLGDRWVDELHWVPKVVSTGRERLIVLLDHPERSVAGPVSEGAGELMSLVRRHADPARLVLVVAGSTAPELLLTGGRWGEGALGAGRIGGGEPLPLGPRAAALDPVLVASLAELLQPGVEEPPPDPVPPLSAYWELGLAEDALSLVLWVRRPEGWVAAPASRWTGDGGWGP